MRFVGHSGIRRIRCLPPLLSIALVLSLPWSVAGCGCPAALLSGELVAQGEALNVDVGAGAIEPVEWPFGYGVRRDGDSLVLTNIIGGVEAREGDHVDLGGGEFDGAFRVCGQIDVRRS